MPFTKDQSQALSFVQSSYFDDVIDVLALRPEAAEQSLQLREIALHYRALADVRVDELIAGVDDDGCPRLVQYIRIVADPDTFQRIKNMIRSDWNHAINREEQSVFPVILRKVDRV
jgi:hypothetical protein